MKQLTNNEVLQAERIAIPKGEANEVFRLAFTEWANIEIPEPDQGGGLSASSGGRTFWFLRAMDIPSVAAAGLVDIGVCGTDALYDNEKFEQLRYTTLGEEVCRFSVLTKPEEVGSFRQFMSVDRRYDVPLLRLPTSRPRALERVSRYGDFPFRACLVPIGGSVEAYASLLGARAVADIVDSGDTAKANNLSEAYQLLGISPEIVAKAEETAI